MVSISLTKEQKIGIIRLVLENRDSGRLQNISDMSYMDSILLLNKLRKY